MKSFRPARVAEVVREVASTVVLFELNDPRIQGVTVTRAEVSADLQHAKVFVSIMGSDSAQRLCLHALRRAAGFVQRRLADRLQMRFTPAINFTLDRGVKNSLEIARLLRSETSARLAPRLQDDSENQNPEEESADQ
jgi:ribosome-binding factor A